MSNFDPNLFLEAQVTQVNERRNPLPIENPAASDGSYMAVIGEVKADSGVIGKGDNAGKPWMSVVIPLVLDVPAQVQEALGLGKQFTLTDRVFLDLTADGKGLDNAPGKNRGQKMYREALDLNKPGDVFSWKMIQGRAVKVHIKHEMYEGFPQERVATILRA